jgi:hypothetical protein
LLHLQATQFHHRQQGSGGNFNMTLTTFRNRFYRLAAIVAFYLSFGIAAQADHGVDAFVFMAAASDQELPAHAVAGKGFRVRPNPQAMDRNHITFHMADGQTLVAQRKRMVSNARGQSWVGQFEGVSGGTVVLSRRNGVISGIIDDGENLYELMPGRSGEALLFQVDESILPPMARPLLSPDVDTSGSTTTGPASTAAAGNVQDIMLVYTAAVRSSYGSTAATEAALLDAVIATNQAYVDSLVDIQLNVAHIAEVGYTETGDMGVTLSRLRTNNDSYMDQVFLAGRLRRRPRRNDFDGHELLWNRLRHVERQQQFRAVGLQRDQEILFFELHPGS